MGKVYGYVRVSSTDQHEDRQPATRKFFWFIPPIRKREVFRLSTGTPHHLFCYLENHAQKNIEIYILYIDD